MSKRQYAKTILLVSPIKYLCYKNLPLTFEIHVLYLSINKKDSSAYLINPQSLAHPTIACTVL